MSELSWPVIVLLWVAASGIGFSKSGFSGVGMFHVIIFAKVFEPLASTGILLPLLIIGDLCAVVFFGHHVQWRSVRRLMPPAITGVIIGWLLMKWIHPGLFNLVIGLIILGLTIVQVTRIWRPKWFEQVPHAHWFAWSLGLLAGVTTMIANAAGPIVALYLLSVSLPKYELVGTNAWFFLMLNSLKIPFSAQLGLIDLSTIRLDLLLAPSVLLGIIFGRWLIKYVPQRIFDSLVLAFTAIASLRLIFS
jgi:uncharacterized membrane protein YfcA